MGIFEGVPVVVRWLMSLPLIALVLGVTYWIVVHGDGVQKK
jgi:hypothetical protein